MSKIVITVEGGIIQEIASDSKEVEVCVLDFDKDGIETPKITTLGGRKELCNIYEEPVSFNKKLVNHYFNELKKADKFWDKLTDKLNKKK